VPVYGGECTRRESVYGTAVPALCMHVDVHFVQLEVVKLSAVR
jgi:hypothetical protein